LVHFVRALTVKPVTSDFTYFDPYQILSVQSEVARTTAIHAREEILRDARPSYERTGSYDHPQEGGKVVVRQRTSEEVTTSNGRSRTTRYEYAHEDHQPSMGPSGSHQLTQKHETTVFRDADGDGELGGSDPVYRRSWTEWMENPSSPGHWVLEAEWEWSEALSK
jgi:hypothetical protein